MGAVALIPSAAPSLQLDSATHHCDCLYDKNGVLSARRGMGPGVEKPTVTHFGRMLLVSRAARIVVDDDTLRPANPSTNLFFAFFFVYSYQTSLHSSRLSFNEKVAFRVVRSYISNVDTETQSNTRRRTNSGCVLVHRRISFRPLRSAKSGKSQKVAFLDCACLC